ARKLRGRLTGSRRTIVPWSTSSSHRVSYSRCEPSHQTTASGRVRVAISSTQRASRSWVVGRVLGSCVIVMINPSVGAGCAFSSTLLRLITDFLFSPCQDSAVLTLRHGSLPWAHDRAPHARP